MVIIESREYDVIIKKNRDWLQREIFTVIYGLQIKQFQDFHAALSEFNNCIHHSRGCNNEY